MFIKLSLNVMLNRFILLFAIILFSSNALALKLEKGEYYLGELKKVESFLYNLNLPKGEWEVFGINRVLSNNNESYVVLAQIIDDQVSAFIWLDFITDPSEYGWWTPDSSVCNDYENQKSNYHSSTYKKQVTGVSKGSCVSVWVDNDIYPGSYDFADEFVETKKNLKRINVELPNAIIWIDQLLITKQAYAGIYIGINPEFNADIFSESEVGFTYSDWHFYNIESHKKKNDYMNKVISAAKDLNSQNYKALEKRKVMDFSFVDRLLK